MATYGLNPDGLLASGEELRGVTRSIEQALADLDQVVNKFITANVGNTAASYQTAQNTWHLGMGQMNAALNSGASAIDQIRDTYQVADTQGAALFDGAI
ncbi:WXG100 family type VII secretion target [Micromonospora sp. NBC_01699]|jgi:WXG100 family type VII secretion target|uniref:WXG100 family type VII secretion target n=1 Tax=Micromonospora sp. NBC_01699 TaxID=2975984 RepID=UPI002E308182|nr:WXG100 family type VII secretion target [Micromonospora sp. NBC_01699]